MAQFDVYRNINEASKSHIPYLIDVQNDILKNLASRVVVPLVLHGKAIENLNPTFEIEGHNVMMSTTQLSGISLEHIGEKVCSLEKSRDEIIGALDFLITGF